MKISFAFIVFLYGAAIGSFLNVVIFRLHDKKTVSGRSQCPFCKHQLSAIDLIPIISYLLLSGKCRYCGHKISLQYPLVEFSAGIAAVLIYLYSPYGSPGSFEELLGLFFFLFVTSILIVVSVYDLRWGIIPDRVVLPSIVFSLLYLLVKNYLIFLGPTTASEVLFSLLVDLLTASAIGGFFALLIVLTRGRGMGGGDFKLSIFIGLALGFPTAVIALLLAFLTGAVASTILLLAGKKGLKSSIPFGPF